MSISVGKYSFSGPYTDTDKLKDNSGVYAIHCLREKRYYLIDIGESAKVKERIDGHDRKNCWKRHCKGTLTYSVLYTPNEKQAGRRKIEQELRKEYDPPCGKI